MIVGQNGESIHGEGEIAISVMFCTARFPGAPVIVGHPWFYMTRMAHDPNSSGNTRGQTGANGMNCKRRAANSRGQIWLSKNSSDCGVKL